MMFFRLLDRLHRHLLNLALGLAGCGMLFMAAISTADVITYLVLGKPFPGASESVEVMLAVTVALTIAYAQYRRNHIAVDILVQHFSARGKMLSDFGSLIVGATCMILIASSAWDLALESIRIKEVAFSLYSFPIYPWKVLYALGISLAGFEFLRQSIWMLLGDGTGGAWQGEKDISEGVIE